MAGVQSRGRTSLTIPYLLKSARGACCAAVLWDSAKRPVEDGKWTGVQLLGRRPGALPHSWQYLVLGGPANLPEACPGVSYLKCYGMSISGLSDEGHGLFDGKAPSWSAISICLAFFAEASRSRQYSWH